MANEKFKDKIIKVFGMEMDDDDQYYDDEYYDDEVEEAVSYTHLDVYKRQTLGKVMILARSRSSMILSDQSSKK